MIYMDNGATTRISREALDKIIYYNDAEFANPSASYRAASRAAAALAGARREIADRIGAEPEEIYFTSGGTEANNLALIGGVRTASDRGRHLIVSRTEHSSVLKAAEFLESSGLEVSRAPCDAEGLIDPGEIERLIRAGTVLISVMYAGNEVGTIQRTEEIGALAARRGIIFHTDAVAAAGCCRIDVRKQHIDLMSVSGHKFGGPKGVGFLYRKKDVPLKPLLFGGGQESGLRAGTENLPGIMGMAAAFCKRQDSLNEHNAVLRDLQAHFISSLKDRIKAVRINGSTKDRLPGNVHFSVPGMSGERLVMCLDMEGVCVATGSACSSGDGKPSHVLVAMGLSQPYLEGSVRATLSTDNTKEEIDFVVNKTAEICRRYQVWN